MFDAKTSYKRNILHKTTIVLLLFLGIYNILALHPEIMSLK